MPKIEKIVAREILDSMGNPTVSATVFLDDDSYYFASTPAGFFASSSEVFELRDRDNSRYRGLGVLKAVNNINTKINNLLVGQSVDDPIPIDKRIIELDSSENKSNLGVNAIFPVSVAINKAAAGYNRMPLYKFINSYYNFSTKPKLPIPIVNMINGGRYADSNLDIQEFWIIPEKFNSFKERLRCASEIFHELGNVLSINGYNIDFGNCGGYAPSLKNTEDALKMIILSIHHKNYNDKVYLGADVCASNFYNNHSKKYILKLDKKELNSFELINYYMSWVKKYPFKYIEDPLNEEDWNSWTEFKKALDLMDGEINIIGDDLFSANKKRLQKGIDLNCVNSVGVTPSQIGTVMETIDFIKLAQNNNLKVVVSGRSGETIDDFIADLAVGCTSEYIKIGSISRGERICKYNRLLQISDEII